MGIAKRLIDEVLRGRDVNTLFGVKNTKEVKSKNLKEGGMTDLVRSFSYDGTLANAWDEVKEMLDWYRNYDPHLTYSDIIKRWKDEVFRTREASMTRDYDKG